MRPNSPAPRRTLIHICALPPCPRPARVAHTVIPSAAGAVLRRRAPRSHPRDTSRVVIAFWARWAGRQCRLPASCVPLSHATVLLRNSDCGAGCGNERHQHEGDSDGAQERHLPGAPETAGRPGRHLSAITHLESFRLRGGVAGTLLEIVRACLCLPQPSCHDPRGQAPLRRGELHTGYEG